MSPPRDPELEEFIDELVPKVAPGAKRGPSAVPPSDAAPRSGPPTWVIVVAAVAVVGLAVIGVLASLAIYGVRRYIVQAKVAEGRAMVATFAQGITGCVAENGKLPETSPRVPVDLAMIGGKKYQSASDDWNDEAFRCANFKIQEPQHFQYQWVLGAENDSGKVVAVADLDGNGDPEVRLQLDVDCSGDSCRVAQSIREVSPVASSRGP